MRSNHTNWVPGPFLSGLSETKKVLARMNSAHVQVKLENSPFIFRSRCAARSQNRSARFTQQGNFVGSFFAPIRQLQNQVLAPTMEFKMVLVCLDRVVAVNRRHVPKI